MVFMRIFGIDPGLAIVGWGIVDYEKSKFHTVAYGALRTQAGLCTEERLQLIYQGMCELLEKYRPDAVSIEELFFNTNITTGIRVAEARGVLLLAARQFGAEIQEYTPLQVKQAVVGYGRAEKKQVMSMVTMLLGLKETPKPDDTADALALAICHAHSGGSRLASYYNKSNI